MDNRICSLINYYNYLWKMFNDRKEQTVVSWRQDINGKKIKITPTPMLNMLQFDLENYDDKLNNMINALIANINDLNFALLPDIFNIRLLNLTPSNFRPLLDNNFYQSAYYQSEITEEKQYAAYRYSADTDPKVNFVKAIIENIIYTTNASILTNLNCRNPTYELAVEKELLINLRYLQLPNNHKTNIKDMIELSKYLQVLVLGNEYNEPFAQDDLPANLHTLILGNKYDRPFAENVLPANLNTLILGENYNQNLDKSNLPRNLKKILINKNYGKMRTGKIGDQNHFLPVELELPISVEELCFMPDYLFLDNDTHFDKNPHRNTTIRYSNFKNFKELRNLKTLHLIRNVASNPAMQKQLVLASDTFSSFNLEYLYLQWATSGGDKISFQNGSISNARMVEFGQDLKPDNKEWFNANISSLALNNYVSGSLNIPKLTNLYLKGVNDVMIPTGTDFDVANIYIGKAATHRYSSPPAKSPTVHAVL